jgi:uncharacterized protein
VPKIVIGEADGKDLKLDVDLLIPSRLLIQANSGGGKSWLLRRLAEQFYGKVQTLIIDPEGEFFTLRERYGYVLVGEGGETPADLRSATMLAEKFLQLKASAVCDLYEAFRSRPMDRRQWVRQFLTALIDAPRTLWHPVMVIVDEAHKFCMDAETEILTESGWKGYRDVSVGEPTIAFDWNTNSYRSEPIERTVFVPFDGEMVSLRSDGIDALVTPDHRVVIRRTQRAKGRYKKYPPVVIEASKVPNQVYIPAAGGPDKPQTLTLGEIMCRLLGWVITEGYWCGRQKEKGKYIGIEQSLSTVKGGENVAHRMRSILVGFFGLREPRERKARGKTGASFCFYLGRKLTLKLLMWLTDLHRIPRQILAHGSRAQLESLYLGLMEGDGTCGKHGWTTFYAGHNEGLADDFQELATRLGISTTKKLVPQTNQWIVMVTRRTEHYVRKPGRQFYSGLTWDITVPSGAFVARRRGKVFVTGNCPQETPKAGSMQEREIISGCKDAMIALSTTGRKRGFCAIWATQRLAKLDKDASAEFFNRLVGMTIEDVDVDRAADLMSVSREEKHDFRSALRTLNPGEFFAFGRAITIDRKLVKVGTIETRHPETGAAAKKAEPPPTPEDVKDFLPQLQDLPQAAEEKARSEAEFRREIRELRQKIKLLERRAPAPLGPAKSDARQLERAIAIAVKPLRSQLATFQKAARRAIENFAKAAAPLNLIANVSLPEAPQAAPLTAISIPPPRTVPRERRGYLEAPTEATLVNSNGDLNGPEKKILKAMGELLSIGKEHPPVEMVAAWAGYSPVGGAFGNPRGSLRSKGLIDYPQPGLMMLTEAGRNLVGPCDPPDQEEIWRRIESICKGPERKILRALIEHAGQDEMPKEQLAEKAGYSPVGGAFGNPIGALRTKGLLDYPRQGVVRAAEWLFIETSSAA